MIWWLGVGLRRKKAFCFCLDPGGSSLWFGDSKGYLPCITFLPSLFYLLLALAFCSYLEQFYMPHCRLFGVFRFKG